MKCLILLFCVFLFVACQNDLREPKFFFGPKAHTVVTYRQVPEVVTEFVPSSCIVLEPTLPPCRHVRNLEIYQSPPTRITATRAPNYPNIKPNDLNVLSTGPQPSEKVNRAPTPPLQGKRPPQPIKTHSPYWNWHFLNPFRVQNVTYTQTKTEYITTKVEDPHTVVSFFIRGCRPSRLPFNLSECNKPQDFVPEPAGKPENVKPAVGEHEENKNIVIMAPLKFVTALDEAIAPSKSVTTTEADDLKHQEPEEDKSTVENVEASGVGEVEGTKDGLNENDEQTTESKVDNQTNAETV